MSTQPPERPQPSDERRPYASPRLSVHGTAQQLTHAPGGVDDQASGVPDGQ